MSSFNENTRVQVPAALHLCKLGYTYLDDIVVLNPDTNILIDIFFRSIKRINPGLSGGDVDNLFHKILQVSKNEDLGREFYQMLSGNSGIKLIDFDNPDNNEWHCTTELSCEEQESGDNFRPDITCFVNGLPLAFIEVKKPNNREGILAERARINSRMRNKRFRRFLNLTQLMIFSNNQEYDNESRVPIQGAFYSTFTSENAFFNVFREQRKEWITKYPYSEVAEEVENCILRHRNCVVIKNLPEYKTNKRIDTPTNRILTSMLSKERFLFLVRYGFAYVDKKIELEDGSKITKLEKHIMRYQQLFATLAIRNKLDANVKSGIIWHTQGSGKTALAFYNVRSLRDYYAKRNTAVKFYFIVDRIDLMEQASEEFASRGLKVRTANSRIELMNDIKSTNLVENTDGSPEIMVVNIQKFKEDHTKVKIDNNYSTKLQRIFFIDEAHRGYSPKGSFLANLLSADSDSVKIALTGTPLLKEERESWRVFGDYIDKYYYDKSIADGYTLKLMREPIETVYKEKIEDIIEKLAGNVKVKKSDIDRNKIIEHESYLNALIDYIIDDFRRFRIEQNDSTVGGMIVCKTNPQARELYRLWQKRFKTALKIEEFKFHEAAMAAEPMANYQTAAPLSAVLILHDEGDKLERKDIITDFKKAQNVDFLIVNQMLLTGFDAPKLKKLYLGRSLDGHDLLQALTRVNRPYHDFKYGYVVDFVDIKENFEATNDRYMRELNRTADDEGQDHQDPPGALIIEDKDTIMARLKEIKSILFNFTCDDPEAFREEIDEIESKDSLYELRNTLNDAKALINQIRSFGDDELKTKAAALTFGAIPTLITEVTHRIERINLLESSDHKADVSSIINVALSALEFEFKKGLSEELRIIVNDIRERCERVQTEFEANFDQKEEQFVVLAEEFRKYFREKGFVPKSTKEAKESIAYMDEVMKKIREINRRNNMLKKKYKGDERFVRIHKRIGEENQRPERKDKPVISATEFEIAQGLLIMKTTVDDRLFNNINVLDNEDVFQRDVLAVVGTQLLKFGIKANLNDRKYIRNLIADEYLQQYHQSYMRI